MDDAPDWVPPVAVLIVVLTVISRALLYSQQSAHRHGIRAAVGATPSLDPPGRAGPRLDVGTAPEEAPALVDDGAILGPTDVITPQLMVAGLRDYLGRLNRHVELLADDVEALQDWDELKEKNR